MVTFTEEIYNGKNKWGKRSKNSSFNLRHKIQIKQIKKKAKPDKVELLKNKKRLLRHLELFKNKKLLRHLTHKDIKTVETGKPYDT